MHISYSSGIEEPILKVNMGMINSELCGRAGGDSNVYGETQSEHQIVISCFGKLGILSQLRLL